MEDIGSLVFYIILGIIALAGSVQGKGKKKSAGPKPAAPKQVQRRPEATASRPTARNTTAATRAEPSPARPAPPASKPSPWFIPAGTSMEGRYKEPMASEFEREGTIGEPMAGDFSYEGSYRNTLAEAFAGEGSIADSMAAAFSSEGVSSLGGYGSGDFVHTEISDSEIGDAPEFDYDARPGADIHKDGFDLKKAVIFSSVLDRKEYSR